MGGSQQLPVRREAGPPLPPAVGMRGRVAVLGQRPWSARRMSDGLVVTHVPDLRGEGETLSVRPPVGPSEPRGCGGQRRRSPVAPPAPVSIEVPPRFSRKEPQAPGPAGEHPGRFCGADTAGLPKAALAAGPAPLAPSA